MTTQKIIEDIQRLKEEKNAVILAHNYQRKEIQEIADIIGDSLDLSRKAQNIDADIIVFAGVKFMAETAKILSPDKKVLLPHKDATCEMADMVTREDVIKLKKEHPGAKVVCYVNTYADVKAECDICCTSRNAANVVKSLDAKEVIFIPDRNLGSYVQKQVPDKKIILYDGYCYVHDELITAKDIMLLKEKHPYAIVISHPEARKEVLELSDYVASTNGMLSVIKNTDAKEFIIGTEIDMTTRLKHEFPDREFYPASENSICRGMKTITLENIYKSLKDEVYEVILPQEIIEKAKDAILKMVEIS